MYVYLLTVMLNDARDFPITNVIDLTMSVRLIQSLQLEYCGLSHTMFGSPNWELENNFV